jgi:hypothetical protein
MGRTKNTIFVEARRILGLSLIFVFLYAFITCSVMAAVPMASAHPCCPKSEQPDPDQCAKLGCISNTPVLPTESVAIAIEFPVIAHLDPLVAFAPLASWAEVTVVLPEFDLFVQHHEFLI